MNATVKYLKLPHLAIVTGENGRTITFGSVFSLEEAEEKKQIAIDSWIAADEAEEERKQEAERKKQLWEEGRIMEEVAQKLAKAAATPKALAFLTFLKVVHHKETVPYYEEIVAELKRLDDEEHEAIDDMEDK